MKIQFPLLAIAALTIAAPGWSQTTDRPSNPVTILVKSDATVQVDGRKSNSGEIDQALAQAASRHGAVMFYREGSPAQPTAAVGRAADTVVNLVIKYKLPICFAADATFKACRKITP